MLEDALNYLHTLIAQGMDYADAQYKASSTYSVCYKKLQEAYDGES